MVSTISRRRQNARAEGAADDVARRDEVVDFAPIRNKRPCWTGTPSALRVAWPVLLGRRPGTPFFHLSAKGRGRRSEFRLYRSAMTHHKLLLLGAPLLAACLDNPPQTPDELPQPNDEGERFVTEEGAYGRVRVRTPDGPMVLSYQVVGGHAIHEIDMDLGPVSKLRLRGGAARLGYRWPDGLIRYAFDESLSGLVCEADYVNCMNARDRVRDTLEEMETKLPLRFVEVDEDTLGGTSCFLNPTPACDGVVFRYVEDLDAGGKSSHTGMEGGVQYISLRPGHATDSTSPLILYSLQPTAGTIRHEMLHAAGLWHEQSRNDRDAFIQVNWSCIVDGSSNGNYEVKSESADLGPYDFASIMHYGVGAKCIKDAADKCICDTMTPIAAGASIGTQSGRGGFSIEDANTVYRMYARPPGKNSMLDRFASSLARGDFDGDGYTDLAVGVPDEDLVTGTFPNLVTQPNAGKVSIWKGTPFGLVAWMQLTQASFTGQSITADMEFGTSVVAYDADADGVSDLAVGAPGPSNQPGAVFVFKGSRERNLIEHRMLTQGTGGVGQPQPTDRFGTTLAAGPLTGMLRADNCGGPKIRYDALAVSAPLATVPGSPVGGAVYIYQETVPSCSTSSVLSKPTVLLHTGHPKANGSDDFGSALAIGDIDADGKADLAVGARNFDFGKGTVYLYKGTLPSGSPLAWGPMAIQAFQIAPTLVSRFGSAIAIGKILPFGRQVVVGAPRGGSGISNKVIVFTANVGSMNVTTSNTLTDDTDENTDEFGAALAIGNVDRASTSDDLVVGVPGEDTRAGSVVIFRGGTAGFPTRTKLQQSPSPLMPSADRELDDQFGASLAIGHFNGADDRASTADQGVLNLDLVIGAPGEKPDLGLGSESPHQAGAFDMYLGTSGIVIPYSHRHQEVAGRANDP